MKKHKSGRKNILALGVLFFVLFFATNAFFIKPIQTIAAEEGFCGSADMETLESLDASSSSLCDSGEVSNFTINSDGWEWSCLGDDNSTDTDDDYCFADKSKPAAETTGTTTTGSDSGESRGIDLTLDDVVSIIQKVAKYFYSIAIVLAVILTIYVGILFFTAGGAEGQITKARKMLIYLVIGIAIMLIGRGIITFVQNILETGSEETMINFINKLV